MQKKENTIFKMYDFIIRETLLYKRLHNAVYVRYSLQLVQSHKHMQFCVF